MFGIEDFTAIVNPPLASISAVDVFAASPKDLPAIAHTLNFMKVTQTT